MFFFNKIEKFVLKRVAVLIGILSVLNFIFINQKWLVFLGLVTGGGFALLRFCSLAATLRVLLAKESKQIAVIKSIMNYLLNLLTLTALLVAALLFDRWFALGVVSGIFTVPLMILINNLTEGLGITHNNYE